MRWSRHSEARGIRIARRGAPAASAVLALAVAGCGGSATSSTTATTATTATVAPTTSTASAPTAGVRLRGTDYAFELAPAWSDTTLKRKRAAAVDRVISIRLPRAVTEIAILRTPGGSASAAARLRAQARRELAGVHATASTRPRPLQLDGAPALTYQYRSTSQAGVKLQSRQVLAVHGGRLHIITLVAGRAQFGPADTALGTMLATWRWTTA